MNIKAANSLMAIFIVCIASCDINSRKPLPESYQNREDRCEGRRESNSNSDDIPIFELVSARVQHTEQTLSLPKSIKIRFYLPESNFVHLAVREISPKYNYWMIKDADWKKGFGNMFEWPTQTVLTKLERLNMYDLGVVAQLKSDSTVETVAPVILYYKEIPKSAYQYLFTFKSTIIAYGDFSLREEGGSVIRNTNNIEITPGVPLVIPVDLTQKKPGKYRLECIIKEIDKSNKTQTRYPKSIIFYHQPEIPDIDEIGVSVPIPKVPPEKCY